MFGIDELRRRVDELEKMQAAIADLAYEEYTLATQISLLLEHLGLSVGCGKDSMGDLQTYIREAKQEDK